MPDDPIIITGGSLRIKVTRNSLREVSRDPDGTTYYEHPATSGKVKSVKINNGQHQQIPENSSIEISFDVP